MAIDRIGPERLEELRREPGLERWAELDDLLFACGQAEVFDRLRAGFRVGTYWRSVPADRLFVARAAHPGRELPLGDVEWLVRGGPFSIAYAATSTAAEALRQGHLPGHRHGADDDGKTEDAGMDADAHACKMGWLRPFDESIVLARQAANAERKGGTIFGEAATEIVQDIDGDRWFADVETLAGWNRHSQGSQIDLARDWLVTQMNQIGLATRTESFVFGPTTAYNVFGTWTGTTRPDEWYLVGAHYDSTSEDPSVAAPGAEDNASGCAGVLELARVLVPRSPEATIVFACYSGEEQGLHGSDDHAGNLVDSGDAAKLERIHIMDMIGYTGDADLDLLLETFVQHSAQLDALTDAAAQFTDLRIVISFNPFGSDHMPYLNRGLPAYLAIENDYASYPEYHRTGDLPANVTIEMGAETLRISAAVLAQEAGARAASALFANGFESGNANGWSSVVGAP